MSDTVIFIDQIFTSSGVETYIYRMSKWLRKNKYNVILLLPENCEDVDDKLLNDTRSLGVDILFSLPKGKGKSGMPTFKLKLNVPNKTKIYMLSTTITDLYISESIMYSNPDYEYVNIAYMLHPESFIINNKSSLINKILFLNDYKQISSNLISQNVLYFLSEEHRNSFVQNVYKSEISDRIIRLGVFINEINYSSIKERYSYKNKKILTISRFDFPFKNYLKGLIKSIKFMNEEVYLEIIGWGNGESELKEIIDQESIEIKQRIKIIKRVSYSELQEYFKDAYLYVGEGTSVLDALNSSLLAFVTNEYDDNCKTDGYFFKNYNVTTTECKKYQIKDILNNALDLSEEQYKSQIEKDYNKFCELYDINTIMNQILNIKNKKIHVISKYRIRKYVLKNNILNILRYLFKLIRD